MTTHYSIIMDRLIFQLLTSASLLLAAHGTSRGAILWYQDFTGSGTPAGYVGTDANQFDAISSSGAGLSWSVADGALQATRTGNAGALTINGDDFGTPLLLVELRLQISSITAGGTTAVMFAAGSSFTTANTHPDNESTHSDFSLNFTGGTPDSIRFRDHDNGTNLGDTASGTDAIETGGWIDLWWGINNSGNDLTYFRPDGSTAILRDDRWDLWANIGGTWHQIGNNPSNTSNTGELLDDFKISFVRGEGTLLLDSIRLSDTIGLVPEPAPVLMAALTVILTPIRRNRPALRGSSRLA